MKNILPPDKGGAHSLQGRLAAAAALFEQEREVLASLRHVSIASRAEFTTPSASALTAVQAVLHFCVDPDEDDPLQLIRGILAERLPDHDWDGAHDKVIVLLQTFADVERLVEILAPRIRSSTSYSVCA